MKVTRSAVSSVVLALLECPDLKKATKFLDEKTCITATRPSRDLKTDRSRSYVLTIGRPNYANRAFIRAAKKAGEPFPVRKLLLKWFPKKRKA